MRNDRKLREWLDRIAPEDPAMAAIRADARKKHPNGMSMREINREIAAYRRERRLRLHTDSENRA
jgi:hypothetical protein